MAKKIIKVEETKKKKKSGINLDKIKTVIKNNPQAVKKITEGLGELIINNSSKTSSKTTTKKTIKKTNKKSSTSDVSNTIKTISKLFK